MTARTRGERKVMTRNALVSAAASLIRDGMQPTVAEAAELAGVHRATAYRYFPTPRSLAAEASLLALLPSVDRTLKGVPTDDPVAMIDASVSAVAEVMFAEEAMFRTVVSVTIDRWFEQQEAGRGQKAAVRETRRFEWIDRALEPLADRLPDEELVLVRNALAMTFGSEAVIVLRDVCGLKPSDATRVMRWLAQTVVERAIESAASAGIEAPES